MNNILIRIYTKRKALMLSVIFFTTLFSCKKDGELYPEFNSENLIVSFTDTLSISTKVLRDDSINTFNVSSNLLGIYNDSIFGLSSASFYSELTLSGANVNFGNNAIIDSIVLSLKYKSPLDFYGELFTPMDINVYELTEEISGDEYNSAQDINYNPTPIGNFNDTLYITTPVKVINNQDTTSFDPHLRIRLNDAIGQTILNAGDDGQTISNNDAFKSIFKGLYISPSSSVTSSTLQKGKGAIVSFDVNSSLSTVTLYYHNDSDTTSYSFIMNSESKKFNRFDHNYAGTDVEKHINNTIDLDSTLTYVQSMGGVKTKIEIPNIKDLAKIENIIINKAEIVFPLKDNSNATLQAIQTLALTGINESGDAVFLIDNFEGTDYFGGTLDAENKTYSFNIARHIQRIITGTEEDYGLYLIATGSAVSANRSVLNSAIHPTSKMKLNITYSKP
ncbi:DUF4270 domain-containing protein [Vicingus serpentipes]|uniref:DUF4270 domain-containing protein n=1 Tax=Vicingus serpentipes TaxID=1926625 RepID=A0A5C6RRY0_9FLAO|nr:DUF4270 domain-containing protein [Vicingus serpentipes]TXB64665.1 DUF4270 domain-containing protein [Vicingus serpentipes]